MKIYELLVWNESVTGKSGSGTYKLPITPIPEEMWLPVLFCTTCGGRPSGMSYPVPEAQGLPPDHPAKEQIRIAHERTDEARQRISNDYASGKSPLLEDDIAGSISPEEYHKLAVDLRNALQLPANRRIYPASRVGRLNVICNSLDIPDFCEASIGSPPVVTRRVLTAFSENDCTGWQASPVEVTMARTKKVCEEPRPALWELLVIGDGGIPAGMIKEIDYTECPTCGFTIWRRKIDSLYLDMSQWDGSDIFCFLGLGGFYITERCKHVIESAQLSGVTFVTQRNPDKSDS